MPSVFVLVFILLHTCCGATGVYVLHDVFECVGLCFLEVVASIYRVEPCVEEILGPLAVFDDEAAGCQTLFVLGDDEVYPVALEVGKGFDDGVWGYDGCVCDHEFLEARRSEEVRIEGDRGVHDECGRVEVPEEC